MDKEGAPLSRREKMSLTALTGGAGLLGGFVIWLFPTPGRAFCGVAVMLLLWFLGPGTWFAFLGCFGVRGPARPSIIRASVGLLNLTAIVVASASFWLLSLWRHPWQ